MFVAETLASQIVASKGNLGEITEILSGRRQMTGVRAVKIAYPSCAVEFDAILNSLGICTDDLDDKSGLIFNYFTNRLSKCPICGKVIIKGQGACSPEHIALLPHRRKSGVHLSKDIVYTSSEDIIRKMTEHLDTLNISYTVVNSSILIKESKLVIKVNKTQDSGTLLDLTEKCQELGYSVFHIFEFDRIDIWLSMIDNKLGLNTKIFARKCVVKDVPNDAALEFLNDNHIQGKSNSSVRLGLYHGDRLVSLMTFSKARFTKHFDWELVRFCSLKGYTVVGAASRLFKHFIQEYSPKSITSYANRRFSQGNLYKVLGFDLIQISKPNYQYIKDHKVYNRVHFQKHKLVNLPEYKATLTEVEIMERSGYSRLFDCGNYVFGLVVTM